MQVLVVFLGGGTGAVLRWWVSAWWPAPWGTLLVNVLGSAALAALMHPSLGVAPAWRLAVGTGLLGGFTTYSTFNLEVLGAVQAGEFQRAGLTVLGTWLGCLGGGALGWWLAGLAAR